MNGTLPDSRFKLNFRAVAIVLQSNRYVTCGNAKDKNLQWTCSCNDIFQNAVPLLFIYLLKILETFTSCTPFQRGAEG